MDNVCVVWPSYGPDSACLEQSVLSVLRLGIPADKCYVMERDEDPVSPEVSFPLLDKGVNFIPTEFHRQLRKVDIKYLLQGILESMDDAGVDYAIQLDSDTILCSLEFLERSKDSEMLAAGWTWPGQGLAGCGYLIQRYAVETLSLIHI